MKFTKLTVYTKEETLELLTLRLSEMGADGFEINSSDDIKELVENTVPDLLDEAVTDWLNAPTNIAAYIPDDRQGREVLSGIETFLKREGLEYELCSVAEEDWENNWKQYFKPFKAGGIIIKPSWEEPEYEAGTPVLEIDPGSAFGTGQHATTRMCIELLEKYIDDHVLDIGSGSGILSAAAWLLGAHYLAVVDISENAVRVTEETLRRNNIGNYTAYCGDIINDKKLRKKVESEYIDIVIANITADVIIAMSKIFPRFTSMHTLILSGIVTPRLPEVLKAIEKNFKVIETREDEGWVALVCHRKCSNNI
jgi:ribosomal protein L11 methyltransferase